MNFIMEMLDEEFQFTLEMIILSRNDNGATLREIRDDFQNHFDMNFESILGYNCWEYYVRPMLANTMPNINSKVEGEGCILYYMNIDAAIEKLSYNLIEHMAVCDQLGITLEKVTEIRNASIRSQSSSNSSKTGSIKNSRPKSTSSRRYTDSTDCKFYGHSLIGDDFFLEMAHVDLKYRKYTRNNIQQIGQCISGQTLDSAVKNVKHALNDITNSRVIINLGSVDLLQGREVIDMMVDAFHLCSAFCEENIFPIMTTIPPLANQMHNENLEPKRKSFNRFLMENFDCIDIEPCLLTHYGRIEFASYQPKAKTGTGSRRPFVLWNHIGRQVVIRKLKRRIPYIYNEYCD